MCWFAWQDTELVNQDLIWQLNEIYLKALSSKYNVEILTNSKIKSPNIVDIDLDKWTLSWWYEGQYVGEAILSRLKGGEGEIKTDPEERPKLTKGF